MKNLSKFFQLILLIVVLVGCGHETSTGYSGVQKINQFSSNLSSPVWSPTGQDILVSSVSYPQNHSEIYKYNVQTAGEKLLVETGGILNVQSWSPDGIKIAFASFGTEKFREGIWIMDADGENPTYMGPGQSATWSPDSQQMAILSCDMRSDNNVAIARIRITNLMTKAESEVYSEKQCASNFYLAWSRDGKYLAFSYALYPNLDSPQSRVYVLDITSGQVHQLVDEESWSPSWSPNSDMIVFVTRRSNSKEFDAVVSKVNGTCTTIVRNLSINIVGEISWSADGTKWAITGGGNLYVVNIASIMGENFLQSGITCP